MTLIVIGVTYYLCILGYSYYILPIEERFFHEQYHLLKPSGIIGQGLGVVGTVLIVFGVTIYILRKRYGIGERFIRLKYLLEFHIFLCTLGPIMILFHTTFKFGGIVSIAFWSMVAVVLSGVIGRFIYIQIPRSIEGRALSISEIQTKRSTLLEEIMGQLDGNSSDINELIQSDPQHKWGFNTFLKNRKRKSLIKKALSKRDISTQQMNRIIDLNEEEMSLSSRIARLESMQNLFKLWHVIHMPFAIIMLIIVLIHVGVTVTLGYKWIF